MQPVLAYPILPAPRTAVLIAGFRSKGSIQVFPDGWTEETARFHPQAIAARLPQFRSLHGIANPTHALILLRNEWEPPLSSDDRDELWRSFRVPVFEQIIDERCHLLASECEAHEGLHVESRSFVYGDHEIDHAPCPCGKKSPRLKERESVRHATASL